jgi:hypothetical protein
MQFALRIRPRVGFGWRRRPIFSRLQPSRAHGQSFKEKIMACRSRFIDDPNLSVAERDVRRQVHGLRNFYNHLVVFAVINSGLAAINLIVSPDRLWFYWPLLGWGVWLVLHAFATFARGRWLGAEWEERKVRQLMAGKSVE